jgi:hypothetical protein
MIIKRIKTTNFCKDDKAIVFCEVCKKKRQVKWYSNCWKEEHLCRSCATTRGNIGKKRSLQARANMAAAQRRGKLGKRMHTGYVEILMDIGSSHPRCKDYKGGNYVFEHILVVEAALGRYLQAHEIVHHIDMDRANNSIENLYLCSGEDLTDSKQMHNKAHKSAERLVVSLLKNGLVKFDRCAGEYKLATVASNIL